MYIILGFLIGIVGFYIYKTYKKNQQDIEWTKWKQEDQERQRKNILNILEERKKEPLLCKVCTKKKRKKTYLKGLSWYHCPVCNHHGFLSIYGDKGECTNC